MSAKLCIVALRVGVIEVDIVPSCSYEGTSYSLLRTLLL